MGCRTPEPFRSSSSADRRTGRVERSIPDDLLGTGSARGPQQRGLEHLLLAEHTADSVVLAIRRQPMAVGERRQFRMAWICAPALAVEPQPQAYTRLTDQRYLFESLDGSAVEAELSVDEDGIVLDCPGLFRRVETCQ